MRIPLHDNSKKTRMTNINFTTRKSFSNISNLNAVFNVGVRKGFAISGISIQERTSNFFVRVFSGWTDFHYIFDLGPTGRNKLK